MRVADPGAMAGGDDDAFYSPKSSASCSSDASFVSTTDQLGRSPFEDDSDLRRASSGLVSFPPEPAVDGICRTSMWCKAIEKLAGVLHLMLLACAELCSFVKVEARHHRSNKCSMQSSNALPGGPNSEGSCARFAGAAW